MRALGCASTAGGGDHAQGLGTPGTRFLHCLLSLPLVVLRRQFERLRIEIKDDMTASARLFGALRDLLLAAHALAVPQARQRVCTVDHPWPCEEPCLPVTRRERTFAHRDGGARVEELDGQRFRSSFSLVGGAVRIATAIWT